MPVPIRPRTMTPTMYAQAVRAGARTRRVIRGGSTSLPSASPSGIRIPSVIRIQLENVPAGTPLTPPLTTPPSTTPSTSRRPISGVQRPFSGLERDILGPAEDARRDMSREGQRRNLTQLRRDVVAAERRIRDLALRVRTALGRNIAPNIRDSYTDAQVGELMLLADTIPDEATSTALTDLLREARQRLRLARSAFNIRDEELRRRPTTPPTQPTQPAQPATRLPEAEEVPTGRSAITEFIVNAQARTAAVNVNVVRNTQPEDRADVVRILGEIMLSLNISVIFGQDYITQNEVNDIIRLLSLETVQISDTVKKYALAVARQMTQQPPRGRPGRRVQL